MSPGETHITLDGQSIPVAQAMDGVRAGIAAGDDALAYLHEGMAQPIGQALEDSKKACDYIKRRIKRFGTSLDKSSAEQMGYIADTLGSYVGTHLQAGDQPMASLTRATIAAGLGADPVAPTRQQPAPTALPPFPDASAPDGYCIYADCRAILEQFHPEGTPISGIVWGYRVLDVCKGDTIPCPAGLACLSDTWYRVPYLQWAAWPGLDGLGQFDSDMVRAYQWALTKCAAQPPPTPPVPPPVPPPTPPAPTQPPAVQGPTTQCIPVVSCDTDTTPTVLPVGDNHAPYTWERDWVEGYRDILSHLEALGNTLLGWLDGKIDAIDMPQSISVTQSAALPGWAQDIFGALINVFVGVPHDILDRFKSYVKDNLNAIGKMAESFHSCGWKQPLGIAVVRGVAHFLTHFDPFDIIHINIRIEPMERWFEYAMNASCPNLNPHLPDIWRALRRGLIDYPTARGMMFAHGITPENADGTPTPWWHAYASEGEWIRPHEFVQWARRQDDPWSNTDIVAELQRRYGFTVPDQAEKFVLLYDELPTIADHIHWLQRNVFDDDYVRDYDLLSGFEERFWTKFGRDLHALGYTKERAKLQYAAHWINPSIGQLAEMVQRLRPGRVPGSLQFTETDFLRILAEQDVAPYFRERLRQIAYRTLPIRQLTAAIKYRSFDRAEIVQRWMDIGFKASDAEKLADVSMIDGERMRASQMHLFTPAVVASLWPAGQISRAEARAKLAPQGLSAADVDELLDRAEREERAKEYRKYAVKAINDYASLATKAYGDGVVSAANATAALKRAGYSDDAAALEITTIDLRVRMERTDEARKAIRKSFLRGELSAPDAEGALVLAGVLPGPARDYVSRWALELTVPRKSAATSQILKWGREGILSVANVEARLRNLGWNPPDIVLMLTELDATLKQAAARAAARRAADLAKATAAADRVKALAQKSYCKLYTPGKLKLWFAERIIDEDTLKDRLDKCGYSREAADGLLKEARLAREKRDADAAKKGALGIEYTGPGSDTS